MKETKWLSKQLVRAVHERSIAKFGGARGVRDENALEAALARPRHKFVYEDADIADLAAVYAYGLAKNHPFTDGNKRVALLSIIVFLRLNAVEFAASEAESVIMMRGLAAGEIEEKSLAIWIAHNIRSRAT